MKPLFLLLILSAVQARPQLEKQQEFQLNPHDVDAHMGPEMAEIRALKMQEWGKLLEQNASVYNNPLLNAGVSPCVDGLAAGTFPCLNVDLHGYLSHFVLGDVSGNDIWGWTSEDGREIALVGQATGTSFVEVLADGSLRPLGRLPTQTEASLWRDIKVIDGYAYIGSEATDHGIQIFDLRKLLTVKDEPLLYGLNTLTGHYDKLGSSHNLVANEETKTIYAVGSNTCAAGPVAVNVSDPANPTTLGCFGDDGYVHDSQCLVYRGPDMRYHGRPMCFNFAANTLTITDHSDESNVQMVSNTSYPTMAYVHQGWFASDAHDILLLDDELDELQNTTDTNGHATTFFWNVTSLTNPFIIDSYVHTVPSIDHNLYTKDGYAYHANYASGLRVTDIRNVGKAPGTVSTVAYFDVWHEPYEVRFVGAWSAYPYFKSGYIVVNSIGNGVFSVKRTDI